ncbi:nuclear transport factor 2-like protein [Marilutibacter alkalisoli]|uniref:Nuclear transport factor 2 family protein n=1 Tax=Marilutibacter alkalisoli TaxID=2591633 RepID=A0A514BSB0_9GAMM|nr:nuclear transport factor 2 family protein [Lysobacter alkalisoli]QDH70215.1 hypothetical protein FKV23_09005 [Lysobacter alkalisoli]
MNSIRSLMFAYVLATLALITGPVTARAADLTPGQMEHLVRAVTAAQNRSTAPGVTVADVDRLFALYAPGFIYEHPGMDDVYTREQLYGNHVRAVRDGRFERDASGPDNADGYQIEALMYGTNAVAVQRRRRDVSRMAVFEFEDGKVSRIREYWNY